MTNCFRILLVDDEPFILSATAALLRSAGHTVFACEQWTGVAAAVRNEQPDIILLDYNMPSIRGDELCRILKKNTMHDMKIVIFSSEPEDDLRRIVAECGADGYIPKQSAGHVLLKAISEHLQTSVAR